MMRVALGLLLRPPLAGWVVPWREVHRAPVEVRAELGEILRSTGQTGGVQAAVLMVVSAVAVSAVSRRGIKTCRGRAAGSRARRQRGPRRRPRSWPRVLLDHADRILAAVREAESAFAAVKGTVGATATLAALPSTVAQIVAPALTALRSHHTQLAVTCVVTDTAQLRGRRTVR